MLMSSLRTIAGLLLVFLLVQLVVACGQVNLSESEYYERAEQHRESGDLRAAVIDYKNALQMNPSSAEARRGLGLISFELGDLGTARTELERALELGANHQDVSIELGRVWLASGEYEQILDGLYLEEGEPAAPHSQAWVEQLRGEAFLGLERPDEAMQSFKEALQVAPTFALAHVGIAAVHMAQGQIAKARASLQTALDVNPTLHQGWNLLGDLERAEGRMEDAAIAYGEAIEHGPTPYFVHLKRGLTRMGLQDQPGAEADLKAMRALGPGHPGTAYLQGLVHLQRGEYSEAQRSFEESLGRSRDFQPAVFYLGAAHFAQQQWRQAEAHLERFLSAHPDSNEAAALLAAVRLRDGDLERAEGLLRPVLGRNPDDILALNLMGNVYLVRGDYEAGIDQLRRLTSLRPDDTLSRVRLATTLLQAGERREGLAEFEAAVRDAPDEQRFEFAYVWSLLQNGEFDVALQAAERLSERLPDSPVPLNLKAGAYMGLGDRARAQETLESALRIAPRDPDVSTNLAQLLEAAGNLDEARRILEAGLRAHPGHLAVSMRLSLLEAQRGDAETMRALLEQAIQRNPEALAPRLVLGRFFLGRNEPRRVLALLEPVRESASDDAEMLSLLARAQIGAGLNTQAATTLRALSERAPATADSRRLIGQYFEQAGSLREARAHYREALQLMPEHAGALQSLAALELREGRTEEALGLAQRMQLLPEVAAIGYAIEARVDRNQGRHDQAAQAFGRAYELAPSEGYAAALGAELQDAGKPDEAARVLAARIQENPDEDRVRLQLARVLLNLGRNVDAIREYEELARTQPQHLAVLNNLAILYDAQEDTRALEYAERAHELSPEHPAVADTLGWILVKQGELERGLRLLEAARAALPDHPEVRYHYAAALAKAERGAEARQELAALLDEVEQFDQRAEAEALLRSLR